MLASLGGVADTLAPVIEALLRVMVGAALVPHGLRITFGFFRNTGLPQSGLPALTAQLGDRARRRPALCARPVHPRGGGADRALSRRLVPGALGEGRLVLEHAGA